MLKNMQSMIEKIQTEKIFLYSVEAYNHLQGLGILLTEQIPRRCSQLTNKNFLRHIRTLTIQYN